MAERKRLPIGTEFFDELIEDNRYYVDKTGMIAELLRSDGKVNLFTRPRRFGKSLMMSTLKCYLDLQSDPALFDGLAITKDGELCERFQGQYPVVSISLKAVDAESYSVALSMMAFVVNREAVRFSYLADSDRLSEQDKANYRELLNPDMDAGTIMGSLYRLTSMLERHHGRKVVVLIDEYDVPLAKANEQGFYDQMVHLMRGFLGNALKTNDSLQLAVLTGCLRVAKESIFTGLNNFRVYSITDERFDRYYGFTDDEVSEMLRYYGLEDHAETVREWYDGYRFGATNVYCPWDVINYVADHRDKPSMPPRNYWLNSSGNAILEHFIDGDRDGRRATRQELEILVNGGIVQKEIHEELTYKELYSSIDNIWSALFMTGYLTHRGEPDGDRYRLALPNREIRNIITEHVLALFRDSVTRYGQRQSQFCEALLHGEPEQVQEFLTSYMKSTISVRDTAVRDDPKENFYHGILLGILAYKDGWLVTSNRESGNGYSDIMVQVEDADVGIVIEVKNSRTENDLENDAQRALDQIIDKDYTEALAQAGVHRIHKYGIACWMKRCRVMLA